MGSFVDPPFGDALVKRGLPIVFQVEEKLGSAVWGAKDISASRWSYRVRARTTETGLTFIVNEAVSKSTNNVTSGWLDHYLALGTTAYDTLFWEIVEVDSDNADASTPTTKRERLLLRWKQPII